MHLTIIIIIIVIFMMSIQWESGAINLIKVKSVERNVP